MDGHTDSTIDGAVADDRRLRTGRAGRRVLAVLLWVFVAAAAVGVFGVRSMSVSAASAAVHAQIRAPKVTRPGEPANWSLQLRRAGGFPGPIVVSTNDSYLSIFDLNDLSPNPTNTEIRSDTVAWTFDRPEGDDFTVQLDGNVDTNTHLGRHRGTTTVQVGDTTVTVHYTTWTAP
jgi:hypothetical protein